MGILIGSGWTIGQGWDLSGGPPAGTEIVTLSGLNLTTISGALFITI